MKKTIVIELVLREIIDDGKEGYRVPSDSIFKAAYALPYGIESEDAQTKLGIFRRQIIALGHKMEPWFETITFSPKAGLSEPPTEPRKP